MQNPDKTKILHVFVVKVIFAGGLVGRSDLLVILFLFLLFRIRDIVFFKKNIQPFETNSRKIRKDNEIIKKN